ncbi:MAG: response regulator transcription factor [Chloroflexota bacterium]
MAEEAKILLVDDDPDVHAAVASALQTKPYRVVSAYSGGEALRKVVSEEPDLVILDVMMPGKNGFEVCLELKTDARYRPYANIPVLMLTVYPDERDKMHLSMRRWVNICCDGYLQKPFDVNTLLAKVDELLRGRSG